MASGVSGCLLREAGPLSTAHLVGQSVLVASFVLGAITVPTVWSAPPLLVPLLRILGASSALLAVALACDLALLAEQAGGGCGEALGWVVGVGVTAKLAAAAAVAAGAIQVRPAMARLAHKLSAFAANRNKQLLDAEMAAQEGVLGYFGHKCRNPLHVVENALEAVAEVGDRLREACAADEAAMPAGGRQHAVRQRAGQS
ncbi:hypothetical protein FNF27_02131 [Cafeteria roenbergensis]|uniref:Uncharacterized protein n=1 Tax=Cafeteria roenbergensis TaxID=33653 RepID=A0A5A8EEW6_CAFRO|nr:hypothetical protein FNF31_01342 [Cafeteria roenbergensis]KAA0176435.1 hypothetical protein FNF27_02131 [Cafeteria roenbergensis]